MQCLFCDIINNKKAALKVWENDRFLVILDIRPINPGHLLLIPKEHFGDVYEIPEPLFSELFQTVKKVAAPLKEAVSAVRIGLAVEGFGVPHVHLHLVPVNNGNELNPERAKRVSEVELQEMHSKISAFFKNLR
jgi:histidine triad (HIT) family protein